MIADADHVIYVALNTRSNNNNNCFDQIYSFMDVTLALIILNVLYTFFGET